MTLNKKLTFLIATFIVISIEVVISLFYKIKDFDLKNSLETITLTVSVIGIFTESTKEKKGKKRNISGTAPSPRLYTLNISFENGIYGGVIGGTLAGLLQTIVLYINNLPFAECLKIIPFCAMIGCLYGGLLYFGRHLFTHLNLNSFFADFLGCFISCVIASILSGMLGMWLFGDVSYQFVGFNLIIAGAVIGATFLILGTLTYDYEGKFKYVLFSLSVALITSTFISMVGFLLFENSSIAKVLNDNIYSHNMGDMIEGGAIAGIIVGLVMGLIVGFTVVFYRYWRFAEKNQLQPVVNS